MEVKDKVKEIIASILEVNVSEILDSYEIGDVNGWDWIRQLMIISSLEEEFCISYPEEVLFEMTSVAKMIRETKALVW